MNMLGIRQPEIYGKATYQDLCDMLRSEAEKLGVDIVSEEEFRMMIGEQ